MRIGTAHDCIGPAPLQPAANKKSKKRKACDAVETEEVDGDVPVMEEIEATGLSQKEGWCGRRETKATVLSVRIQALLAKNIPREDAKPFKDKDYIATLNDMAKAGLEGRLKKIYTETLLFTPSTFSTVKSGTTDLAKIDTNLARDRERIT